MPEEPVASEDSAADAVEPSPQSPEAAPPVDPQPGELFEVVGSRAVYGVEPGDVGRIVLTPGQRFALIAAGHIRPAVAPASDEN